MELSCCGHRTKRGGLGLSDVFGDPSHDQHGLNGNSHEMVPMDGSLDRLLELLPESGHGGRGLQIYWRTFGTLDWRSLLKKKSWSHADMSVFNEIRLRCRRATFPFGVAQRLLQDSRWDHANNSGTSLATTEAFWADRRSRRWSTLQAVKTLLGQLSIPSLARSESDICQCRDRYMTQVHVFSIIVTLFDTLERRHMRSMEENAAVVCTDSVQTFLAVQQVLRSARDPIAAELLGPLKVGDNGSTHLPNYT